MAMIESSEGQHPSEDQGAKDARWQVWIEVITTVIMAITVVAVSWSSYQAARWGGVQSTSFSRASSLRVESVRASLTGYLDVNVDITLFSDWIDAISTDNQARADFLIVRMRDEMKPAMDEWLTTNPFNDPEAPTSPFVMDSYHVSLLDEAYQLEEQAAQFFENAQAANQQSDDYVLTTVLLASVLFFAGIATRFKVISVQIVITIVAASVLLLALFNLATYPVA
jgi:hypothetical protein